MAHQIFEQLELPRLQVDRLAAAPYGGGRAGPSPDRATSSRVGCLRRRLPTPKQRLDAGEQLGEGVGLDQIVVAARFQALHPVVDLAQGAQDQDRGRDLRRPQRLHQRKPVEPGQHAIDDDGVVITAGRHEEAVATVAGPIHRIAALGEGFFHEAGGPLVVLDHQDLHDLGDGGPMLSVGEV